MSICVKCYSTRCRMIELGGFASPMEYKFDCPHCRQKLSADDSVAGMTISCPYCNKQFALPAATAPIPASNRVAHTVLTVFCKCLGILFVFRFLASLADDLQYKFYGPFGSAALVGTILGLVLNLTLGVVFLRLPRGRGSVAERILARIFSVPAKAVYLLLAFVVLVSVLLFAPWKFTLTLNGTYMEQPAGYHLIMFPPKPAPIAAYWAAQIDITRYIIQVFAFFVVGAGIEFSRRIFRSSGRPPTPAA